MKNNCVYTICLPRPLVPPILHHKEDGTALISIYVLCDACVVCVVRRHQAIHITHGSKAEQGRKENGNNFNEYETDADFLLWNSLNWFSKMGTANVSHRSDSTVISNTQTLPFISGRKKNANWIIENLMYLCFILLRRQENEIERDQRKEMQKISAGTAGRKITSSLCRDHLSSKEILSMKAESGNLNFEIIETYEVEGWGQCNGWMSREMERGHRAARFM